MRPTEHLRSLVKEDWRAATRHAFTNALADGTLSRAKMRAYLEQDYLFVESFVRLLASAIAHAPSLADVLPGERFLDLVTSEENTYFERALTELGADPAQPVAPGIPTQGFQALMAEAVASGRYANMLATLVVAEWVYLEWASPFEAQAVDLPFWLGEWITLHAGVGFEGVVAYLRGQLDDVWPTLSAAEQEDAAQFFRRAVALERAFFDAAWTGEWHRGP